MNALWMMSCERAVHTVGYVEQGQVLCLFLFISEDDDEVIMGFSITQKKNKIPTTQLYCKFSTNQQMQAR